MAYGSMTCDLGEIDSFMDLLPRPELGMPTMIGRSATVESDGASLFIPSRAYTVRETSGPSTKQVRAEFEQELLNAIKTLADEEVGRVFTLLLSYINQMKAGMMVELRQEIVSCKSNLKILEEKVSELNQHNEQLTKLWCAAGRRGWMPLFDATSRSAPLVSRANQKSRPSSVEAEDSAPRHPSASSTKPKAATPQPSRAGPSASSQSRMPIWLRINHDSANPEKTSRCNSGAVGQSSGTASLGLGTPSHKAGLRKSDLIEMNADPLHRGGRSGHLSSSKYLSGGSVVSAESRASS